MRFQVGTKGPCQTHLAFASSWRATSCAHDVIGSASGCSCETEKPGDCSRCSRTGDRAEGAKRIPPLTAGEFSGMLAAGDGSGTPDAKRESRSSPWVSNESVWLSRLLASSASA